MLVSVVIKTKDRADRLRLVLASLSRQTVPLVHGPTATSRPSLAAEIVVVDDGSTDHTRSVIEAAAKSMPLRALHNPQSLGRSAACNEGAREARGDVLLILDGDTLAAPDLIERHAQVMQSAGVMTRGETFHLRCTRFFLDPETGTPFPGHEQQVLQLGKLLASHLVTTTQVTHKFQEIEARAQGGIYPGVAPRLLYELEMDALTNHPDLGVLWMAAAGHNAAFHRRDYEAAGGYDPRIFDNEHRELAFRLCERGVRLIPARGAKTYHLTHQTGWRDPLKVHKDWEQLFYTWHPCAAVKLMSIFWLSISQDTRIPPEASIQSLVQLDQVAAHGSAFDYDALRRSHPHLGELCAPSQSSTQSVS